MLRYVRQGYENGPIGHIRPGDDIFDAIQDDGARGLEQRFILIGIKPANRKAATAGEPAQRIRGPGRQIRQIVEGKQVASIGGDEEIALFTRGRPDRCHVGIDQGPQHFGEHRLGRPLLAGERQDRGGAAVPQRSQQPGDDQNEVAAARDVAE